MIEFEEIKLEHKGIFDEYFNKYMPECSEMSFTNLFIWRYLYGFRFGIINDILVCVSFSKGKKPFALMPIGEFDRSGFVEVVQELKIYFNERGEKLKFERLGNREIKYFVDYLSVEDNKILHTRQHDDYVYLMQDMINLKGKKYHQKRTHLRNFSKNYESEYIIIDETNADKCLEIMKVWADERNLLDDKSYIDEKVATEEMVSNFKVLGCKGALIKINGEYKAFTIGETLNENTAVIHLEKAHREIRGLYVYVGWKFCKNEYSAFDYLNVEQDLGLEGLRKSKLSYYPTKMIEKHEIYID